MSSPLIAAYRAVWEGRTLISFMVRNERRSEVGGTVLGELWYLALPLAQFLIYYMLVVVIFGSGTDLYRVSPFTFLIIGLMHYFLLQYCALSSLGAIASKSSILLQIKLEPIVLVAAGFRTAIKRASPGLFLALAAWAVAGGPPEPERLIAYPLVLAALLVFGWAIALLLSAAAVFARDLGHFVPVIFQLLMYMSPVLYGLQLYPERVQSLLLLNPIAALFSWLQWSLGGQPTPPLFTLAVLGVTILGALLVAHWFYGWARPRITKSF